MHILKGYTKQEISWMMYDWANSAHSVIIVTLLPIFFDTVAGYTADSVSSMSTWGYATSIAMLIVALAAPFLGVFGDIRGMRKKLFSFFMLLGVEHAVGNAKLAQAVREHFGSFDGNCTHKHGLLFFVQFDNGLHNGLELLLPRAVD